MCQKNSSHPYLLRHSSPTPGLNSSVITRQAIVSASILLCCFDLAVCWAIGVLTPGFSQKTLPSALLDPEIIDNKLAHDLKLGRVVEVGNPTCPFISSSLGLVRKHDGGFRKIHHLSSQTALPLTTILQKRLACCHIPPSMTFSTRVWLQEDTLS